LLSGCDSKTETSQYDFNDKVQNFERIKHADSKKPFYFGFDLRASPQEDARQYLPFLAYLEKETGYSFKLYFTPKDADIVDLVGQNHVQFAALGAVSFLRANTQYHTFPLARGVNHKGKAEYQSAFVVASSSKIKSIKDIKGKRLAFGSQSSTQGHLIPRIVLAKQGYNLKSFESYTYTGSHQNCANSVISNKSDVCAMQDTMAKTMEKRNLLRIIHLSDFYPSSGIVANKNVASDALEKIKNALLHFKPYGKDKAGLYHWDWTEMPRGFANAKVEDYEELKKWAIKFGFIEPTKEQGK